MLRYQDVGKFPPRGRECALIGGDFQASLQRLGIARGGGMLLRGALAISVVAICVAGAAAPAMAQTYPAPPRQILPQQVRPLPPVAEADDDDLLPPYDPPAGYRQQGVPDRYYALPPRGYEPAPAPQFGRRAYPEDVEPAPLPPGSIYREPPPGYEPIDPRSRIGRPNYGAPPPNYGAAPPPNYGAAPPPNYGAAAPSAPQEALRPPMSIGPNQEDL